MPNTNLMNPVRLRLREDDMATLARKPTLSRRDLTMLVEVARDIVPDVDRTLALGYGLPETVQPVIGLLRAVVMLAGEAGRPELAMTTNPHIGGRK